MRSLGNMFSARGAFESAQYWYGRAARGGDPVAMFDLGWINGELVNEDFEKWVAEAKRTSVLMTPADYGAHAKLAAYWYRESASAGFAPAMNNLAECYRDGIGVGEDAARAFAWHRAAAEKGNPAGMVNLAYDYLQGVGTPKDRSKASQYWMLTPAKADPGDLDEPTFERTLVFNQVIPDATRERIRAAAKAGTALPADGLDLPETPVSFGPRAKPSTGAPADVLPEDVRPLRGPS